MGSGADSAVVGLLEGFGHMSPASFLLRIDAAGEPSAPRTLLALEIPLPLLPFIVSGPQPAPRTRNPPLMYARKKCDTSE
jgi:hypothetical protein